MASRKRIGKYINGNGGDGTVHVGKTTSRSSLRKQAMREDAKYDGSCVARKELQITSRRAEKTAMRVRRRQAIASGRTIKKLLLQIDYTSTAE